MEVEQPQRKSTFPGELWAVLLGSALLAVSPFLAWVNVPLLGPLNLFQLLALAKDNLLLGLIPVAFALLYVVLALAVSDWLVARVTNLVVAILAAGFCLVLVLTTSGQTLTSLGVGLFASLLGNVVVVVASGFGLGVQPQTRYSR